MTGAPSRISTPASRAARTVRQGDTRRANLELALLAGALVAFLLAVARLAAGHVIDAPGPIADADVVRTWWGFTLALSRSAAIVAFGFLVAHVTRRIRGAIGDPWLLPIACALCGLGLLTMASVNDPWRERLLFEPFAIGVGLGCVALTVASLVDFGRLELHRFAFVFLIGALGLSVLLLVFGSGPGRSGVKVNLFGVQPVEAIRPLIALFLAGYFARRWEWLRELADPLARQHPILKRLHLPRIADVIPVAVGMAMVLLFFFFQRDLGPALVLACTFLVTYSVARDRWGLAAVGLATLVGAFTTAYVLGYPSTVVKRIDMWHSPWDNGVSGGDQVAHAWWGLASGGVFGGGLSETSPRYIPTGENDLVLASLGEILGFAGVLLVLALFATLVVRALRIARRTDQPYIALLVVGLVTSLAAQTLLIVGGLLGLLPLSGVVTPFLSLGRSSMVSNLAVVGLLLAASRQSPPAEEKPFFRPASRLGLVVAALLAVAAGRAFLVQVWTRGEIMTRQTRTRQADGAVRPQDNPRLREVARQIPRGTILDRRGVPVAMDSTLDVSALAKDYAALGVSSVRRGGRRPASRRARQRGLGRAARRPASQDAWRALLSARRQRLPPARRRGVQGQLGGAQLRVRRARLRCAAPRLSGLLRAARALGSPRRSVPPRRAGHPRSPARREADHRRAAAGARGRAARQAARRAGAVARARWWCSTSRPATCWPRSARRGRASMRGRGGLEEDARRPELPLLDRVRYGQYPPGSTFKLVTAAAALRSSSDIAERHFECRPLPDGRVGMQLPRWRRPIRDDATDHTAHGDVTLDEGMRVSCNAYFAQLGLAVGAGTLKNTADAFEIATSTAGTAGDLGEQLPWASYGQAEVARLAVPDGARGRDDGGARRAGPRPLGARSGPGLRPAPPDSRAGGGRSRGAGDAARRHRRHRIVARRPRRRDCRQDRHGGDCRRAVAFVVRRLRTRHRNEADRHRRNRREWRLRRPGGRAAGGRRGVSRPQPGDDSVAPGESASGVREALHKAWCAAPGSQGARSEHIGDM